jgi:hypothetical protein
MAAGSRERLLVSEVLRVAGVPVFVVQPEVVQREVAASVAFFDRTAEALEGWSFDRQQRLALCQIAKVPVGKMRHLRQNRGQGVWQGRIVRTMLECQHVVKMLKKKVEYRLAVVLFFVLEMNPVLSTFQGPRLRDVSATVHQISVGVLVVVSCL